MACPLLNISALYRYLPAMANDAYSPTIKRCQLSNSINESISGHTIASNEVSYLQLMSPIDTGLNLSAAQVFASRIATSSPGIPIVQECQYQYQIVLIFSPHWLPHQP
jgi:hypothetical protein